MRNAVLFILALLALCVLGLSTMCCGTEYNVGVCYYPWYGNNNFHGGANTAVRWHLVPQQQPTLGWYDSHDESVISSHFLWARSAGVDFFVSSYWGSADDTAYTLKNYMLNNPDIGNLKMCVLLEPNITPAAAYAETEYLSDNFFGNSSYYRINNKPVIYLYATRRLSDSDLTTYTNNVRNAASSKGYSVYIIGDEVKAAPTTLEVWFGRSRCGKFDAITDYGVYGSLGLLGATGSYVSSGNLDSWKSANDDWRTVAHKYSTYNTRFFGAITPGFNDTAVRSGNAPMSRKLGSDAGAEGSLFSAIIDKAVQSSDDSTLLVTSWNEWHEDTQIEPVASAAATSAVDGTGGALTNGINYIGYDTTYLDILRTKTSNAPAPPSIPTNPSASNITTSSLQWNWQDNSSNETAFNVYADPYTEITIDGVARPKLVSTLRATNGANTNYWDYTGLADNSKYSLQVIAFNGVSPSLRTTMFSAYTLAVPPAVGSSIVCDRVTGTPYAAGTVFTFTNPVGFGEGPGYVSGYQHAWDGTPTHSWTGNEPVWNAGSIMETPVASGSYYLHLRSINAQGLANPAALDYGPFVIPDITPPVSSVSPTTGAYKAPLTITLSASETATIYYTIDGSEPTAASSVYSAPFEVSDDLILRFFAVDTAGNVESTIHEEVYWMISGSDTIGDVRNMTSATPVRLADKVLFWKNGTSGYIEEANRSSAIRVVSDPENPLTALPAVGTVCLAGTVVKTTSDCYLTLDVITPAGGAMDLKPLGASNAALKKSMMNAMYVKAYGKVQTGSITGDSFVINDGSETTGIKVMFTPGQVTVSEGQYVTLLGAVGGTSSQPLLYLMSLTN